MVDTVNGMKDSAVADDTIEWDLKGGDKPPFVICFPKKDPCQEKSPLDGSSGTATCTVKDPPIAGTYKYDVGTDSCPKHPGKPGQNRHALPGMWRA